jgi:hypothetical protein
LNHIIGQCLAEQEERMVMQMMKIKMMTVVITACLPCVVGISLLFILLLELNVSKPMLS